MPYDRRGESKAESGRDSYGEVDRYRDRHRSHNTDEKRRRDRDSMEDSFCRERSRDRHGGDAATRGSGRGARKGAGDEAELRRAVERGTGTRKYEKQSSSRDAALMNTERERQGADASAADTAPLPVCSLASPLDAQSLEAKRAAWKAKKEALSAGSRPSVASSRPALFAENDDEPTGLAPAYEQRRGQAEVAADFARKQAAAAAREAEHARAMHEDEDALDAFMNTEVAPEVAAKDAAARKREEEEARKLLEDLRSGRVPQAGPALAEEEEPEEVPELEIQVPKHKVKLIIGAGGERIKQIQRKTRTRIQVKKDEVELNRAFGEGTKLHLPGKIAVMAARKTGSEVEMATIMLFGEPHRVEQAKAMLMELVDNKEQKQAQRQKEYDKKREEKNRIRQIYYMRHTRDYEVLGVAVGTPKSDLKAVFRKLALQWHPDRHPENVEEAKKRFQEISKAYESLMTTDEDTQVKAIT